MCSTPRPKRQIKSASAQHTGSIIASMSTEARRAFVARANAAADKRYQQQQADYKNTHTPSASVIRSSNKAKSIQNYQHTVWQQLILWLQMPIADIWYALLTGQKR